MQDSSEKQISVLLVDDHELVREGIARLLADAADMTVIAQLASGEEAVEYVTENPASSANAADVILMDARMPGLGGIEATRAILKQCPNCKIVAMSTVGLVVIPSQILRTGAKGFITKSVSIAEMLQAIRMVASGEHYVTPSVAMQLAVNPFASSEGLFEKLSRRELQIALMLTDGKKVSEIAAYLELSPKTVYSYRYRIFEKLGVHSDVELIIIAVEHGLSEDSRELDGFPVPNHSSAKQG